MPLNNITMKTLAISKTCAALVIGIIVSSSNAEAGLWTSILKILGREVVEEGGVIAVKTTIRTIKTGGSKVIRTMAKEELENLVGSAPVRRMSSLLNMRNLSEAGDIVAHNPSKEKVWKAIADCADLEQSGGQVRYFIRSSAGSADAFTKVNGDSIEEMYRYARRYGLTTESNLARMRQGLAPVFKDGSVAHLDHIIPVKYAPELKTLPANLRILSSAENTSRKAAIDNACRHRVKILQGNIKWKPSPELSRELNHSK